MFALDSSGGVSRLVPDEARLPRIEKLFRLKGSDSGYALAATADVVFVAVFNKNGCTVYRYSLASKAVSQRLVALHERCVGIATDGTAVYVTFPERNEIRVWNSWEDSSPHSWPLSGVSSPGYVAFDPLGHRLIFADASGNAYAVSVSDGQKQLLASNLGMVQSIATSRFHILVASGKKVLFLARSDNLGRSGCLLLGWVGTELACPEGHGLLHVTETDVCWLDPTQWTRLDESWASLFSEKSETEVFG